MSLRARLVAVMLALVAGGLLVADVVTYSSLRSYLARRVEQQLVGAQDPVRHAIVEGDRFGFRGGSPTQVPPGTYGEFRDGNGQTVGRPIVFAYDQSTKPIGPRLPASLPGSGEAGNAREFNAPATSGSGNFRVAAYPVQPSGTLIIAIPLDEMNSTLRHQLAVEGLVSGLVLAGLALLAWWLVRRELRPLRQIGGTAAAIAGGDLSRRVDSTDPRTEVGQLGIALNEMLGQIEHAFDERTASEARLRQFVDDASHELRTPLTSIRGYAELFRRGAADRPEDLASAMRRIEEEAARMGRLVDELLLLARLDQGRPLDSSPVDLAAIAADAVADARVVDPDRPVDLEVSPPGSNVVVTGDEARLRQVAANLVGNALAHTPAGTPVHVRVRALDGTGASLEVADEGPGLHADVAARAFERFYRADQSRASGGGSGLGLAIVAAIADAHGGTASVASTPGTGATFTVSLPH
jgi:two-component system OmpR family sensor kinase